MCLPRRNSSLIYHCKRFYMVAYRRHEIRPDFFRRFGTKPSAQELWAEGLVPKLLPYDMTGSVHEDKILSSA